MKFTIEELIITVIFSTMENLPTVRTWDLAFVDKAINLKLFQVTKTLCLHGVLMKSIGLCTEKKKGSYLCVRRYMAYNTDPANEATSPSKGDFAININKNRL